MAAEIREARSAEDYAAFGQLVRQYVVWCRERYADKPWLVEMAFGYQDLDRELETLPVSCDQPKGKTLLAVGAAGVVQGCVAYRSLGDGVCEMKRMFVPASFHGHGLVRRLCEALIDTAAVDGFSLMRLDTAMGMDEAIAMYRSQGFAPCAPYIDYPERLAAMILFMDRKL